jgi:NAD(P)-dependent dehydrogenase (short-subunit alcohol dehydrogenase family)
MNQLAAQLACEEPQLTALSIRPGVVDTDMQKELRDIHHSKMAEKDVEKFQSLHKSKKLLRPEQPGNVMAKLVLDPPKNLSGQYLK